jgi:hypothetical protein
MQITPTPRILLTGVILELTLATAIIHLTLGGTLFLLNGLGYLALGTVYLASTALPALRRHALLPKAALAAYASITIAAYLVTGPYFTLGWVTKGIELAIISLVAADLLMGADAGRASGRPTRA